MVCFTNTQAKQLVKLEMVHPDERLKKEFPLVMLPVLIVPGATDKATKPIGSRGEVEGWIDGRLSV